MEEMTPQKSIEDELAEFQKLADRSPVDMEDVDVDDLDAQLDDLMGSL